MTTSICNYKYISYNFFLICRHDFLFLFCYELLLSLYTLIAVEIDVTSTVA